MNDEQDRIEAERLDLEMFFRELVSSYVNFPDNLKVELKKSYRSWALMIEPDVCDYAIVAGKRGRNFNALRLLANAIAKKRKMDDEVELLLEGPPADDPRWIRKQLPYKVNPKWTPDLIKPLVAKALRVMRLEHVRLRVQRNAVVNEYNPFDDQSYYWFVGAKSDYEAGMVLALGQLLESVGTIQGRRLIPKTDEAALEKAS